MGQGAGGGVGQGGGQGGRWGGQKVVGATKDALGSTFWAPSKTCNWSDGGGSAREAGKGGKISGGQRAVWEQQRALLVWLVTRGGGGGVRAVGHQRAVWERVYWFRLWAP